jgi:hypothetical protein
LFSDKAEVGSPGCRLVKLGKGVLLLVMANVWLLFLPEIAIEGTLGMSMLLLFDS